MAAQNLIHVQSPSVSYSDNWIEADYEYATTTVEQNGENLTVSKIKKKYSAHVNFLFAMFVQIESSFFPRLKSQNGEIVLKLIVNLPLLCN